MPDKDKETIAAMVKARECCRQLQNSYEQIVSNGRAGFDGRIVSALKSATDRLMEMMKKITPDCLSLIRSVQDRIYMKNVMNDIRMFLERVIVLEREARQALLQAGIKKNLSCLERPVSVRFITGAV